MHALAMTIEAHADKEGALKRFQQYIKQMLKDLY